MRKLMLAILFACVPGHALALEGRWIADSRSGCKLLTLRPEPDLTILWNGHCVNGIASGRGVAQYHLSGIPHMRLEGEWRNGRIDGHGVLVVLSGADKGQTYDGNFRDGRMDGIGTITFVNGDRYEGEWRDNLLDGRGLLQYASGNRYEGEWRKGLRSGQGLFIDGKKGNRYDGQWANNLPNGYGVYTGYDGTVLRGQFVNGCFRHGTGWAAVIATPEECGFR